MNTAVKAILILMLCVLLASVRFFEDYLFYDPLKQFFEGDYLKEITPQFNLPKLLGHTAFRYGLNTILSLLILYVAFRDKSIVKFSTILFTAAFIILIVVFTGMLLNVENIQNFMPLFYLRRFLIQPLFIMLLLPAFYYYKKQKP